MARPPTRNALLEAALDYASRGWRVIPVEPNGKRPTLVAGGHDWHLHASNDPGVLTEWWERWPSANIGILCDRTFGFALDVDDPAVLDFLSDLPTTLTARTPSGGTHFIFSHPPDRLMRSRADGGVLRAFESRGFRRSPGKHAVDVRGMPGGQIVVAPSSRDGVRYQWVDLDTPIAEAPDWLIKIVDSAPVALDYKVSVPERELTTQETNWLETTAAKIRAMPEGRYTALHAASIEAGRKKLPFTQTRLALYEAAQGYIADHGDTRGAERQIQRGHEHGVRMAGFSEGFLKKLTESQEEKEKIEEDGATCPKPEIQVNARDLVDVIEDAWVAEALPGVTADSLFVREGTIVALRDKKILPSGPTDVFGRLIRTATWVKQGEKSASYARPPDDVVNDILAYPRPGMPEVDTVLSTPVFDKDGTLINSPGHHAQARLWYTTDGLRIDIPETPSIEDIGQARDLILGDLFEGFPFTTEADRTHAVALLLLPFARRLIAGATPLHMIESPMVGSGKSLIANVISLIFLGRPSDTAVLGHDEYSIQQKITSALRRAPALLLLDNIKDGIDSATLASALTSEIWSEREMRTQNMIDLPNKTVWMATANNPRLTIEIARRTVRIRIVPDNDKPWKREPKVFKHHPLGKWVLDQRQALIRACLILIRNWLASGAPSGSETLGSFEEWARVMGGVLECSGFDDFLGNAQDLYQNADDEGSEWRALVQLWWEKYQDRPIMSADILKLMMDKDILLSIIQNANTERAQRTCVGKAIKGITDRWFGPMKIDARDDPHKNVKTYRLIYSTKAKE